MSFLQDLVASTRARVAAARANVTDHSFAQRISSIPAALDFAAALRSDTISLIAEIKRATPSQGPLDLDLDPRKLALAYERGGAAAISVLTEPDYFKGSLADLEAARVSLLPLLRKDFTIDPFQVVEARASGADCVLLIVRVVGDDLVSFLSRAEEVGMQALVEVFSEDDLERALAAGATLVGVNHRDLETFEVDPQRTLKLAPLMPEEVTVVAASGVSTRAEVEELAQAGVHAVLVGQSLVTAADPEAKLRELLGAEAS